MHPRIFYTLEKYLNVSKSHTHKDTNKPKKEIIYTHKRLGFPELPIEIPNVINLKVIILLNRQGLPKKAKTGNEAFLQVFLKLNREVCNVPGLQRLSVFSPV